MCIVLALNLAADSYVYALRPLAAGRHLVYTHIYIYIYVYTYIHIIVRQQLFSTACGI